MDKRPVLSLYDYTGNMVRPWAENGHECYCVDLKHADKSYERGVVGTEQFNGGGCIMNVATDVRSWVPPFKAYDAVFAFPPCDNIAVSGARWFTDKGLPGLSESIELVEAARAICERAEQCGAFWMIENPVSMLSTYWRDPDYTFHPYEYDGYTKEDNSYQKRTCLWTSNNFVMPTTDAVEEWNEKIVEMKRTEDRKEKRSTTPMGFARAVYQANENPETGSGVDFTSVRGDL